MNTGVLISTVSEAVPAALSPCGIKLFQPMSSSILNNRFSINTLKSTSSTSLL